MSVAIDRASHTQLSLSLHAGKILIVEVVVNFN